MDYSHLTENVETDTSEDALSKIASLVEDYDNLLANLEEAERVAKDAKRAFNKVSQELIPDALQSVNMKEVTITDGRKVRYDEKLSAKAVDQEKLAKWLESRGDDGLVKCTLVLGKLPQNILNSIMKDLVTKYGLVPDVVTGVHHATLTAYLSKVLGLKKGSTAEMNVADLDSNMVTAYTYFKTVIK